MSSPTPTDSWRYHLRRGISDLWFILSIAAAFVLLLVLFGYHNTDPGWSTSGDAQETLHFLGKPGAYTADALLSLLGYAAYLLPVGMALIGWQSVCRAHLDTELMIWKCFALVISIVSLCGMLSLHCDVAINSLAMTGGGVVGQKITIELLKMWPVQLVMSIYTLLFFIGITLLAELNWAKVLDTVGQWGVNLYNWVRQKIDGYRRAHQTAPAGTYRPGVFASPRDDEASDGDTAASAAAAILPKLRERLLNVINKAKQRRSARAPHTPVMQSVPPRPPQNHNPYDLSGMNHFDDNEPPSFRAPPRYTPPEEDSPPQRSEPNISWAHYKAQNAAAEPAAPAAEEDGYRPKSDYFARRQNAGLPLRSEESDAYPAAVNDPVNDDDLGDMDEEDFAALDEDGGHAAPEDTAEENAGTRHEPQLRVRLNSVAGSGIPFTANRAAPAPITAPPAKPPYRLPDLSLLNPGTTAVADYSDEELDEMAMQVEQALKNYKLSVRVENITVGPVVTCIELSLAPGIKVSSITNLDRDIARLLSVPSVRVVEVIPGRPFIGLEIPNRKREMVPLRGVLESPQYQKETSPLTVVLGSDISGKPVITNLGKMPHLLVAGTTGSGKSVGINVILASMLYKSRPDELKLILVDPKTVELAMYRDIPHLLTPVVTDMSDAENALRWAVAEMERRYQLMVAFKVRKMDEFNKVIREAEARGEHITDPTVDPALYIGLANQPPVLKTLPYIVIVIDELADLMMVAGKNVEQLIARIAQKARAAGIHLILATQRPSVDVITGLIKSNIPTRIAFQVSSKIDSRTILNGQGAETLLGNGDMLFLSPGVGGARRVHGAYIDDQEVDRLTTYLKTQGEPDYEDAILAPAAANNGNGGAGGKDSDDAELDPLYDQAVQVVIESGKASISGLQRHLSIGYNRAARMVDVMERAGLVSPPDHKGVRKVLTTGGAGGDDY
ncbi:DNA translocase FtsK [uncultured Cardiobacterium sp.]|uniref:DNA translocase FtsK n=1 Tax=uncultured Cardiobacterium sp. TaxID=417619 RepID=UPI00262E1103|nr:DNA translocase FtsK [uncultured Cardiobacterium sp.]